jgi:hypothetical protein
MLAGAVAGALMLETSIALPLRYAAMIALNAGASYAEVARRQQRRSESVSRVESTHE